MKNLTSSKLLLLTIACFSFSMHGMDATGAAGDDSPAPLKIEKWSGFSKGAGWGSVTFNGALSHINRDTNGKKVGYIRNLLSEALGEEVCALGPLGSFGLEQSLAEPSKKDGDQHYTNGHLFYNFVRQSEAKARLLQQLEQDVEGAKKALAEKERKLAQIEQDLATR